MTLTAAISESQDNIGIIDAMRLQEERFYRTRDYDLNEDDGTSQSDEPARWEEPLHKKTEQKQTEDNEDRSQDTGLDKIDRGCRMKMAEWCYRVADYVNLDYETVAIAMNILDRYIISNTDAANFCKNDRKTFQLAAMTALYTAVKIHEPLAMDPAFISKMSRGVYQEEEIMGMERTMLMSISWHVNPPTGLAFVRESLGLLVTSTAVAIDGVATTIGAPSVVDLFNHKAVRDTVYHLAKAQTEIAVQEYDFLKVKPSIIAYCALMNALIGVLGIAEIDDDDRHAESVTESLLQSTCAILTKALLLENNEQEDPTWMTHMQSWLYEKAVLAKQSDTRQDFNTTFANIRKSVNISTSKTPSLQSAKSADYSPRTVTTKDLQ